MVAHMKSSRGGVPYSKVLALLLIRGGGASLDNVKKGIF